MQTASSLITRVSRALPALVFAVPAQEHYLRTQSLNEEIRRAYGVPVRTNESNNSDQSQERFAIVRSVAVTAPIESLNADERHRLGILFLLDEQKDLKLLLEERIGESRNDEKRRLANLLNHGVDSLARILRHELEKPTIEQQEFVGWLSMYLSERIQLMAWTLENWGSIRPVTESRIITRDTIEATIARHEQALRATAADRKLREKLHWNNGIVSNVSSADTTDIILADLKWSRESGFAVPQNGVIGFFIGEVLVNAVRHGSPGSKIQFRVNENRIRNQLDFEVTNAVNGEPTKPIAAQRRFGGIAILNELSRLCGWEAPEFQTQGDCFQIRWSIPIIKQTPAGHTD